MDNYDDQALKLWWASNSGAMTHLFTRWIEHSSSSSRAPDAQSLVISVAETVFENLDWGAMLLKQKFAAEVKRLEAESHAEYVREAASEALEKLQMRELWRNSKKPRSLSESQSLSTVGRRTSHPQGPGDRKILESNSC